MLCFLILLNLAANIQGGTNISDRSRFDLGMQLYESQSYYDAITEFYRAICFDSINAVTDRSFYMIGLCERELGNWEKSNMAFQEAAHHTNSDSLKACIVLAEATNAIAQGNLPLADLKLLKQLHTSINKEFQSEAQMLLFLSSVLQHNWTRARELARDSSVFYAADVAAQIDTLLLSATEHIQKSPQKARLLSTILPGTGQFYASDYRNAANAFMLNAVNITLNTMLILNGYYIDGLLYFITFTERYYSGNRYQAAQSVIRGEQSYEKQVQNTLLEYVSGF